jgi:hypothetical protein
MEEKVIKDLLTVEEKAIYFELRAKMYRAELMNRANSKEYSQMYRKASAVLLAAVDRELIKRGLV